MSYSQSALIATYFRVTDKQREVIVDHAKKQGKTMSGFVRDTFSSILKNYTNETRQF
jgi:uncharacterized protein (DUF1778 family)